METFSYILVGLCIVLYRPVSRCIDNCETEIICIQIVFDNNNIIVFNRSTLRVLASPSMNFGGSYPQCQRRPQQEVLPDTTLQYSYWATSTSSPDHNMLSGITHSNYKQPRTYITNIYTYSLFAHILPRLTSKNVFPINLQ